MTTARVLVGDCLESMRTLPDGVARCCVTSPPYFGLRDYGTGTWNGGDPECEHRVRENPSGTGKSTLMGGQATNGHAREGFRDRCPRCGAVRVDQQIGLEETPDAYVARLVEVFREVRRVLADDGTLWLNLGDSYAAAARGGTHQPAETLAGGVGGKTSDGSRVNRGRHDGKNPTRDAHAIGLKHKDLIGIPWRVALALQADGWYLRSDIIWHKPNPMPESVKDRPTKSHEYLFLLTKAERYFYDAEAIAEKAASNARKFNGSPSYASGDRNDAGRRDATPISTRNTRTVWTIQTRPFKGAHFAVFPEALAERCILAGSAPGDTILDPFGGSGTVGVVATKRGRSAILCELNPEYAAMAEGRIAQTQPGLGLEVARA